MISKLLIVASIALLLVPYAECKRIEPEHDFFSITLGSSPRYSRYYPATTYPSTYAYPSYYRPVIIRRRIIGPYVHPVVATPVVSTLYPRSTILRRSYVRPTLLRRSYLYHNQQDS
jgi:hypothetical protein